MSLRERDPVPPPPGEPVPERELTSLYRVSTAVVVLVVGSSFLVVMGLLWGMSALPPAPGQADEVEDAADAAD